MRFLWDRRKAANNLKKHGVSFEEARDAVLDPLAYSDIDEGHGDGREWLLGRSSIGKTLFVVLLEIRGRGSHHQREARNGAREEVV